MADEVTERAEKIKALSDEKTKLKEDLVKLSEDFSTEKFFFTNDEKLFQKIILILSKHTSWKYMEAIYLDGVLTSLREEYDRAKNEEKFELNIPNRDIDTINFFMKRFGSEKGTILPVSTISIKDYVNILSAISDAMGLTAETKKKMKDMEEEMKTIDFKIASIQQGITPENALEKLNEE